MISKILSFLVVVIITTTTAFAADWNPSEDDIKDANSTIQHYQIELKMGAWENAYAYFTPETQRIIPFDAWRSMQETMHGINKGNLKILNVQSDWQQDPPDYLPGQYVTYRFNTIHGDGPQYAEIISLKKTGPHEFKILNHEQTALNIGDAALVNTLKSIDGVQAVEKTIPNADAPKNVADMMAELKARDDVTITDRDGWTVATSEKDRTIWSFTKPFHPAHPAYAKRWPERSGDEIKLRMVIACEGPKAACDQLAQDFQQLNQQTLEKSKITKD